MAWQYLRGAKGQFAGSTGGRRGGGGGGGGGGSKGGGGKKTGKVTLTVKTKNGKAVTRTADARYRRKGVTATHGANRLYLQKSGSRTRAVAVTRIKNGRAVTPKDSHVTRSAVGGWTSRGRVGNTRLRPGTPIGGNRNIRYVSRGHAVARSVSLPASRARQLGRAHSYGSKVGSMRSQIQPKSGYLVSYGPRVKG